MIRALVWIWHRARGNRWMCRAEHMARVSREAFVANRACAERARQHFARCDALYPPSQRGPPAPADPGGGA